MGGSAIGVLFGTQAIGQALGPDFALPIGFICRA
jgi:hypothetical protein